MISVMNDFEIDQNPASAPDLSFFGLESPKEEERMDPLDPEIPPSPVESQDLEEAGVRVSLAEENQQHQRFPPRDSEPEPAPELDDEELADMNGFTTGDMVWGKVKSHPWWPGHIFNESFASSSVRRTKRDDNVLVAFFGDSSYGWFDPAELISFEQHFVEKSRQTNSRSFVRAVEESIDEASRRAALALACRCQNPYNFRPAGVLNYYAVDVVGYERNGIYSRRQINRERESFDPKEVVDFLHKLAVMPRGSETKDVEWHRNVALALVMRRRRYEDFDETYAQAFGQTPVRPAINEMGVPEQSESFAPRVAPLSGPLVIAETLRDKKKSKHSASAISSPKTLSSTSSSHKDKDKSSKKNKYVLKRRDERPAAESTFSPSLPNAFFILNDSATTAATGSSSDYVLQKREPAAADGVKPDEDGQKPHAESPQTPPMPVDSENNVNEQPASYAAASPVNVDVVKKEKKIKKRSLDDVNSQEEAKKKKKKKKQHGDGGFGQDFPSIYKKTSSSSSAEVSQASETSIASPRPVSPLNAGLGPLDELELPNVLADLHSLALDPFYGIERNAPLITRHVFRKFRSLVYSKSLVVPVPGEIEAQGHEAQASKPTAAPSNAPLSVKEAKEQQQQQQRDQGSLSSKPAKLMKRADDPTKAGRKRAPSDRQEEISAKRIKKVNQLKSLASEKKAALNTKASSEGPKGNNGTTTTTAITTEAPGPMTAEPVKKPEKQERLPPPPPKRESPTFLVMKFPPRSTLPSVSNLKARFARFGPLEVDSTRVFWKSHSCRVQFKYKSDAVKALSYVKSNDIFGQIQVEYTIREVEGPALELASETSKRRLDPLTDGSLQFMPGNSGGAQPRQQHPQGRLKSILKKPGDEAAKESQRVKFMLSGNDSPPSASGNSVSFADVAPPQPPPASKSTSFQLPPPPIPPQPRQTLPQTQPPLIAPPIRSYEPQRPPQMSPPANHPVENRALPALQFSEQPPPPQRPRQQEQRYGSGIEMEGKNRNSNVDISHQMLSLLMRCNDIVTGLRALPDFVPYRPL